MTRLVALVSICAALLAPVTAFAADAVLRIEAAVSQAQAVQPPETGWVPVESLPAAHGGRDAPGADGSSVDGKNVSVAWFRLRWDQPDADAPTALLVEYATQAAEIRVNDSLVWQDASLVEPLSRSWNMPRYFVLSPPLLRPGENAVLVRVANRSGSRAALGPVRIGPQMEVLAQYQHEAFQRRDIKTFSLALNAVLGCFFGFLWLGRRSEAVFGWFAAAELAWLCASWNQVAVSPWPWLTSDAFERASGIALVLFAASYPMFVLRLCARRWPLRERLLWTAAVAAVAAVAFAPEFRAFRDLLGLACGLLALCSCVLLIVLALRGRELEPRILAPVVAVWLAAGLHDVLAQLHLIDSTMFYTDSTSLLTTFAIAAVLAWRYVRNLRRIENFSVELGQEVEEARGELARHLSQQHALELSHARIGERLNLVRDLHDGFGGALTGSIAAIERDPGELSKPQLLELLKEVRDDLRLVIDASAAPQDGADVEMQLAPLRHRMSRLFDANGIECEWRLQGLETLRLDHPQTLDLLRFVQEALGNALKHSGASRVEASLVFAAPRLRVEVRDNGRGMRGQAGRGAGMASMQARARRLGGEFGFAPAPGATVVWFEAALATTGL